MTLENDDKTYTALETLHICQKERIPLVFDFHHHLANLCEVPLVDLLDEIFATWRDLDIVPKIHVSSPKSETEFRSHSDFVNLDFLMPLFKGLREIGQDVDLMVEAKMKDQAMLKLIEDVTKIRGVKRISGGTVVWR